MKPPEPSPSPWYVDLAYAGKDGTYGPGPVYGPSPTLAFEAGSDTGFYRAMPNCYSAVFHGRDVTGAAVLFSLLSVAFSAFVAGGIVGSWRAKR